MELALDRGPGWPRSGSGSPSSWPPFDPLRLRPRFNSKPFQTIFPPRFQLRQLWQLRPRLASVPAPAPAPAALAAPALAGLSPRPGWLR